MSLFSFDFWKELRVNDFALACISILSVIFPPAIGMFFLTPDLFAELSFGNLILICLSLGVLFIGSSLNSIGHIYNSQVADRLISFKLLRDVMPMAIINLYSSFVPFIFIFTIPLKFIIAPILPGLELFVYTAVFIAVDNLFALTRRKKFDKLYPPADDKKQDDYVDYGRQDQ